MAAGVALALGAAIAFWPVVTGARSFFHFDLRYEIVPLWHVTQRAILAGHSPFWIDGEYCGHPALLLQEVAPFYPLTIPLIATGAPPHRLADLFSLFHFWLAGFAAFLLLRDLGADFFSGLFAGVGWMLSARVVQSALWPTAVAVSALFPLLLMGLLRIGRGERRSGVLLAAVVGGLALLAFRPQVLVGALPILVAGVTAGLALAPRRGRVVADFVRAALVAAALGAPALIPALALFPLSSRAGGLDRADRDFGAITFHGDLDLVFLPRDGGRRWPEAAAYPGLATGFLVLAGVAMAVRRRSSFPRALFFALLAGGVVGLLFAFGESGLYRFVAGFPVLRSLRVPARFLFSWSLALTVCAGLALSDILSRSSRPRLVGSLLLGALSADLVWHARTAAPTAPSEIYTTEPAVVGRLRQRLSTDETGFPHRFWTLVRPVNFPAIPDAEKLWAARWLEPLSFGLGMQFGLEAVQGHGPTLLNSASVMEVTRRSAELGGVACLIRWLPVETPASQAHPPPPRIALSGFSPLPRALLVPEIVSVPASRAVPAILDTSLDPRRTAVVESSPQLARRPDWDPASGSVRLLSRAPGRVELSTTAPGDAVLVLFQSYERGWKARVDGYPVAVLRADAAFLGVQLPRGQHVVSFEYHPRGLFEGLALAGIGVGVLALWAKGLPR